MSKRRQRLYRRLDRAERAAIEWGLDKNLSVRARYVRPPEMLDELCAAKDEAWAKTRKRYITCDLLIVDDWLLEPIGQHQTREALEIAEARHRRGSLILCSQFAPSGRRAKLGDSAMADAVVDRIVFNSHVLHIEGEESMRKRMSIF